MSIVSSHRKVIFSAVLILVLLFLSVGTNLAPSVSADKSNVVRPEPSPTQKYQPAVEPQKVEVPREPVPAQVIIQFAPNTTEKQRAAYIQSVGGTVVNDIGSLDTVVINVSKDAADAPLPESSVVTDTEPDYYVSALDLVPNDPRYVEQWALPAIGAPSAWEQMPSDAPKVTVAVIDSGICASHPDLAGRIVDGWDFLEGDAVPQDDYGHGCSVTGVIAANMNDGVGIAGVAPNAQIMPLRVLNASGVGSYSDVAAAIVYAADHEAQVINLSLGGSNPSSTLEDAVNYATSKGVIVVAAAGNNGTEGALFPAAYPNVIAVGSVDPNLQHSSFSNYGSQIDIWAPGRDILTTKCDGSYGLVSGTSFAAPYVAGAEAVELELRNKLRKGDILYLGYQAIDTQTPIASSTFSDPSTLTIVPTQEVTITPTTTPENRANVPELQDFGLLSQSDGWILIGSHLYLTNDGGVSWSNITPQTLTNSVIYDVKFLDRETGWVLWTNHDEQDNLVLQMSFTTNQGSNWNTVTVDSIAAYDPDANIASATMYWLNETTGWISVKRNTGSNFSIGTLFRTDDGGQTWLKLSLPIGDSVYFISKEIGWIAGGAGGDELYYTNDGGVTWARQTIIDQSEEHLQVNYLLPKFRSLNEGILPVIINDGKEKWLDFYYTNNAGLSWTLNRTISLDNLNIGNHPPLEIIDTKHYLIVIPDDNRIVRVDDQQVETVINIDNMSADIEKTDMISLDLGWSKRVFKNCNKINENFSCSVETQLLTTSTGGQNWTPIVLPEIELTSIRQNINLTNTTNYDSLSSLSNTANFIGAGFDSCAPPSVSQMQDWKNNSPYALWNLYIGGSNRGCKTANQAAITKSFISQLSQQGWKFIPTWVGPQASCTTHNYYKMSSDAATAFNEGVNEANSAADVVTNLGLPGTIIYYDLEGFNTADSTCLNAAKSFISGWTMQLRAKGNSAGVYGSASASAISYFANIANVPDAVWIAGGGFWSTRYDSNASVWNNRYVANNLWSNHQRAYQYTQGHDEKWGSTTWGVDSDVIDGIVANLNGGTQSARCDVIKNQNGVSLFDNTECNGNSKTYASSTSINLTDVSFNDVTRSIQIGPNFSVKVWADINQNGASRCMKRADTNGAYAFWDLYKDFYDNSSTRIWSSAGEGSNITSIKVYNNESCTEPVALVDDAAFVGQSAYPTVDPGQSFSIYFEVRNSGTSTWQSGSYWLQNLELPMGASSQLGVGSSIAPGATKRWDINLTAPSTPGTYSTKWMVNHNGTNFGPYMYINVTVRQPSTCSQLASEVRLYDQINCSSSAGKVTNGGTGLWDLTSNNFNDKAQSIEVPLGYSARLYKDNSESSPNVCIDNSDANLRDNTFSDGSAVAASSGGQVTWVRIYNQDGCPASAPVTPGNFRQSGATQSSMILAWDDVTNENGYKIYEWNGSGFVYLTSVGANQTTYTDTRYGCGRDQFYELSAYNNVGESAHAGWIHAYTQTCPTVANDDFNNAIVISGVPYNYTQTSAYATEAGDDPTMHCPVANPTSYNAAGYNTVWYRYIPNASGTLTVNTFGSSYDTVLGLWTGSRGALQEQECNDDTAGNGNGAQSQVQIAVTSGITYYIEIAGFSSGSEGSLSLSASLDAKPNPPSLVSPTLMQGFNSRTITFDWNASSSSNTTGYIFRLSQSADPSVQPWLINTSTSALTYQYTFPSDGYFYWHMQATSTTQNSNWVSRLFLVDTTAPTVSITSPASAAFLKDNQINIIASSSDSLSGLDALEFFVGFDPIAGAGALENRSRSYTPEIGDPETHSALESELGSQAWDWVELGWDTNGSDGWSMIWDASSVPDQSDVAFFVYAYDHVGNQQGTASWATVLDRTPGFSAVSTLPAYSSTNFSVNWQGSDAVSGIQGFDLQVQDNGGTWMNWQTGVTASSANYTGIAGHTYGFRVSSHDNAGNVEDWKSVAETETTVVISPANDNFESAALISTTPFISSTIDVRGAVTTATDPTPSCGSGKNSNSVWYQYTAPANGLLEIDTWGSDYDTVLAVWTGASGNLNQAACNDDAYGDLQAWLEGVPVTTGVKYYIEVMDYGDPGGGNLELYVNFAQSVSNNDFNSPVVINANPASLGLNTGGATKAFDDPTLTACNRLPGEASVWYRYTSPWTGELQLDTRGSDYDTMLAVWTGTRGNLTPVGCNDDIGEVNGEWDANSILAVPVTAGTTYYIEASAYAGKIDVDSASAAEVQNKPEILPSVSVSSLQEQKMELDQNGGIITDLQDKRPDDISAQFWGGQLILNIDFDSPIINKVDITIGNDQAGKYYLEPGGQVSPNFPGMFTGPVHVVSTKQKPLIASERAIYGSSFTETLGMPGDQLATDYWFSWYDGLTMRTWISIGAPTTNTQDAQVDLYIGDTKMNVNPYVISPGGQVSPTFPGTFKGPVRVVSTNGQNIIASERAIFGNSFTETLGMPGDQLATEYWFSWYDGMTMRTWISVGAPTTNISDASVDIYIGDTKMNADPYVISPGGQVSPNFPGTFKGPVRVVSTNGQDIIASERAIFGSSFTETLGMPNDRLTTEYWFSWYDGLTMSTWVSIGAPTTNSGDATVDLYIGDTKMNQNPYVISPGGQVSPNFAGTFKGPVRVVSTNGQDIIASERAIFGKSFTETLGMPDDQLTTDYWFSWYDGLTMSTWISIGVP